MGVITAIKGMAKKKESSSSDIDDFDKWFNSIKKSDWPDHYYSAYARAYWKIKVCKVQDLESMKGYSGFHNDTYRKMHAKMMEAGILKEQDYIDFRDNFLSEEKQKKIERMKNTKVVLTPTENWLILKARLKFPSRWSTTEGTYSKSELRQKVKSMRARKNYKSIKKFDKLLRQNNIKNVVDYINADIPDHSIDQDLALFVSAEHDIEGLSNDQINKMIEVESI